jgi:pyruvate formate lyase activating enzyme
MAQVTTLADLLDSMTREGELYEKLPDGKVRCYACAHRCVIFPGVRGICQVRFNRDGVLYVPYGYVGALQCDPIEKKPFYHVMPGGRALTFGMLGCDFHCSFCFPGETPVVTDQGVLSLEEIFERGETRLTLTDGEATDPKLRVMTRGGKYYPIRAAFKHFYAGELVVIQPYYLPALRCTPDHRLYATRDPQGGSVELLRAEELTKEHFLVIPKRYAFSRPVTIDVLEALKDVRPSYRISHKLTEEEAEYILSATATGVSSRELGRVLGKDPSYIRHVWSKVARGLWREAAIQELIVEDGRVRFSQERRPGIPHKLELNEDLAKLLGYYCSEGHVHLHADRPNSGTLSFTVSPREHPLAEEIHALLKEIFGVRARLVRRRTTLSVEVNKASLVRLFERLCGANARMKRVPLALFDAPRPIVQAFVNTYVCGDGHRYSNGKISVTTKSRSLAYGVAWLVLKLGHLPSLYVHKQPSLKRIEGRVVRQAEEQYTLVWYETSLSSVPHRYYETDRFFLIPIRSITREEYSGAVYNLEVDDPEHNYLAGFLLVANCQNWQISQTLRDKSAGALPMEVSPGRLVELAERYEAEMVVSSYNEPLITSEWSLEIFKLAKREGFITGYVSNGNASPEVLDYLRPYLDCYKVDLKTMQDRNYRELGGVLANILKTIEMVYERGFWVEVVTLVIPGFNDSDEDLREAAKFIASVSPETPWHVTAFHPDYKLTDRGSTPVDTLLRAVEIGYEEGLHFVYAGNLPGMVGRYENTYCPGCNALLIERYGFFIQKNRLRDGSCPDCGRRIPGIWPDQ